MTTIPCSVPECGALTATRYASPLGPICADCYHTRIARGVDGVPDDEAPRVEHEIPRVGALPWHWCYGNQPVFVKGSVYLDDRWMTRIKAITEAEADRRYLKLIAQNAHDGISGVSTEEIAKAMGITVRALRRRVGKARGKR